MAGESELGYFACADLAIKLFWVVMTKLVKLCLHNNYIGRLVEPSLSRVFHEPVLLATAAGVLLSTLGIPLRRWEWIDGATKRISLVRGLKIRNDMSNSHE